MPESLIVVVMAAGKSTRFKSERPKLAHTVLGRSLIERVIESIEKLAPRHVYVVVGHKSREIEAALEGHAVSFVTQEPQLGTGHCVQTAVREIAESDGTVLVMNGDIPLITPEALKDLVAAHVSQRPAVTLVSARLEHPLGYGRIVKNRSGKVTRIVEERDATPAQRRIREINVGLYVFSLPPLKEFIFTLNNRNAQKEFYLTDVIQNLSRARKRIGVYRAADPVVMLGVNDRAELATVETILRMRTLEQLMRGGVTIIDPATTSVDEAAEIGPDTVIFPGVRIEGPCHIGRRCTIRSHCRISNSTLEDEVLVNDLSVINESHVSHHSTIGPFAHLRLDARVGSDARVGNFVELKKTRLGNGAKASHLNYLGDAEVGQNSNVGAGTITCNYDGVNKNRTVIEEDCFIGSGVELVAPVTVHHGAYVAAGSVVTEDVPADALAIGRGRQHNKLDWRQKRRNRKTPATSPGEHKKG